MIVETTTGKAFAKAGTAARAIAPKIARKLAEYHRELILRRFGQQPGGRDGPSDDTFKLRDSMKVILEDKGGGSSKIVAKYYWRFAMEYGSYLEVPSRRVDPPRLVSQTVGGVRAAERELIDTELRLFQHRVTGK